MATYTTNLNLKKPADSDSYDIADANGNMDLIDSAYGSLNSNIANGHLVAKYLNDTSKTAIQLLTADFPNVNLGDIQFYRIRPSDDNLYGFIVKHSATYAYGLFAGMNTGDSYNIVNSNGTWEKTKLATNSITTGGSSPVTYAKSSRIVTVSVNGTVTLGANNIIATIPSGYRPATTTYFIVSAGGSTNKYYLCAIDTNGSVIVYPHGDTVSYAYGSCSYMTN